MIEAIGLTKMFGDFVAVQDVNLRVRPGEIVALLGHNGAGKTTTTRMLAAILTPTSGSARIGGYDCATNATTVRRLIGHLTEQPGLYTKMRVTDYLDFFAEVQNIPPGVRKAKVEHYLHAFDLWETRNLKLGEYSKGMRQKTALIRAIMHDPVALFLDEPTSAMDPYSADVVRNTIAEMKSAGRSILLSTHNLAEAEQLADRIAIIRRGQIIAHGTAEQLKQAVLGAPRYRLTLDAPLTADGVHILAEIGERVMITGRGANWFTYITDKAEHFNPEIVRRVGSAGYGVVTLKEETRNLDSVFLTLAGAPPGEDDRDGSPNNRDEIAAKLQKRT